MLAVLLVFKLLPTPSHIKEGWSVYSGTSCRNDGVSPAPEMRSSGGSSPRSLRPLTRDRTPSSGGSSSCLGSGPCLRNWVLRTGIGTASPSHKWFAWKAISQPQSSLLMAVAQPGSFLAASRESWSPEYQAQPLLSAEPWKSYKVINGCCPLSHQAWG